MRPLWTRAPGLVTPWRWLDLVIFFVAAVVVIATSFRVRVYYKISEPPATEVESLRGPELWAAREETSPDTKRVA